LFDILRFSESVLMQSPPTNILGHDRVLERFRRSLRQGRLASTFLFLGPPGIGKRTTALHLAQCLLCETTAAHELIACQTCPGCLQVAALTHPDVILIAKPEDRNFIPIELFIGDREHRMREGLCHDIALKPFRGRRRIAIIDDADHLNQEGANCLLKTLEEPPAQSLIILIGTSEQRQLPTILSRCQIVRFAPLSDQNVAQLLESTVAPHGELTPDQIETIARRSGGSLSRAVELTDAEMEDAYHSLLEQLCQSEFDSVALAKTLTSFVDAAGKEAPPRRARLRQIVRGAADFYRELMRQAASVEPSGDELVDRYVAAALRQWKDDAPAAAACVDRCLEALAQIDANANLSTLISCWIDDLAQIARRAGVCYAVGAARRIGAPQSLR
jgi:DNA polymerase-3 subunit delta'